MAEEELKVRRWVCVKKRHWIPGDIPGRARRRWSVGMEYVGTDTPPEDFFKEVNSEDLARAKKEAELTEFMVPQTLHEQQILDMQNKGQIVAFLMKEHEAIASELGVSEDMKRHELEELAFKILRRE